jgi:hypothetical protein
MYEVSSTAYGIIVEDSQWLSSDSTNPKSVIVHQNNFNNISGVNLLTNRVMENQLPSNHLVIHANNNNNKYLDFRFILKSASQNSRDCLIVGQSKDRIKMDTTNIIENVTDLLLALFGRK